MAADYALISNGLPFADAQQICVEHILTAVPDYTRRQVFEQICVQWLQCYASERLGISIKRSVAFRRWIYAGVGASACISRHKIYLINGAELLS